MLLVAFRLGRELHRTLRLQMKLSPEAKDRVDALITRDNYQLALWSEREHSRVRQTVSQSNPRFGELIAYHVEATRRWYKMIIESYVAGYRMDGILIDEEDREEIVILIKEMVERRTHDIINRKGNPDFLHPTNGNRFPNIDYQLTQELKRVLAEGIMELDVARTELVIEQKKKTLPATYNLTIENAHGPVQQGPGNVQNFSGTHIWNGKPHVRWSQLKPEARVQRVSRVGDVEVTEENIRAAQEIGGDPWVEVHDATTFGSPVRKYTLGLFTPE
jgi:hypothetical protein